MREDTVTNRGTAGDDYPGEGYVAGYGGLASATLVGPRATAEMVRFRGPSLRLDKAPLNIEGLADNESIGLWIDGTGQAGTGLNKTWVSRGELADVAESFWYPGEITTLSFDGASDDNFMSIPDNTALDITTSIDIRCLIAPTRWRTAAGTMNQRIVSKRDASTAAYEFFLLDSGASSGRLGFRINNSLSATSSVQVPFQNWQPGWVRVTYSGGNTRFYYAPVTALSSTEPSTWFDLGVVQTGVTGSISSVAAALGIGAIPTVSNPFTGHILVVNIYNAVGAAYGGVSHIVNLETHRDCAAGTSATTSFTTPRPTLGSTWTVNITRSATDNAKIQVPFTPTEPSSIYYGTIQAGATQRNRHIENIGSDNAALRYRGQTSFIAWARVDTTTMPTIADTEWTLLFGCKDGVNTGDNAYGLPGWGVYMKSDRSVRFEIHNEGNGTLVGTTVAAPNNADVVIALLGNVSNVYQLRVYQVSTFPASSNSSSSFFGTPSALDAWSYVPPFRFADPGTFIPIESVGYLRFPYLDPFAGDDFCDMIVTSVLGDETYVEGDTFLSNNQGIFTPGGMYVNYADAIIAETTSDTPTWAVVHREATPAWTSYFESWGGIASGVALQEPLMLADSDFTVWSVVGVDKGAGEVGWLSIANLYGETTNAYFEFALYEDTGDFYVYADVDDDEGDDFGDIDEIITGPPGFDDCTEPIFVAWTLDRTNDEITVWVNDFSFTIPSTSTDELNFDGLDFTGWGTAPADDPPCYQIWGCGVGFRHYDQDAMPILRDAIIRYLRPRESVDPEPGGGGGGGGEPPPDPDEGFGSEAFGDDPFGG